MRLIWDSGDCKGSNDVRVFLCYYCFLIRHHRCIHCNDFQACFACAEVFTHHQPELGVCVKRRQVSAKRRSQITVSCSPFPCRKYVGERRGQPFRPSDIDRESKAFYLHARWVMPLISLFLDQPSKAFRTDGTTAVKDKVLSYIDYVYDDKRVPIRWTSHY